MTKFVRTIRSMAYEKKRLIEKLSGGYSERFIEHCAKILVEPEHWAVNHWCDEMFYFCEWIMDATIKPDNRFVDRKTIWDNFFAAGNDFNSFQAKLIKRRKQLKLPNNTSEDKAKFDKAYKFFSEVCDKLAEGSLDENNIHQLMDSILLSI